MPRFVDDAGNVWEATGPNDPNPVWVSGPQQGGAMADPTVGTRTLRDQAEIDRLNADIMRMDADRRKQEEDRRLAEERTSRGTLRSGMATNNVLEAIRNARQIAQRGGTGAEILLSSLPATNARALRTELDTVIANLSFDRLQEMREASTTGGALGSITENELRLLGSTVGSLDTGVDLMTFLRRLDKVERHFMGAQMAMNGIDPRSPEGQQTFRDFGYNGVFEGEGQNRDSLAAPGSSESRDEYPQELQDIHQRYLRDNWGNINPGEYANFRMALDQEAGFEPVLGDINTVVQEWNQFAQRGGNPDQLGGITREARDMGMVEGALNTAAQSPGGAFAANWSNAALGGLPSALAGGQQEINLLRDARPVSSTLGEIGGSILGSYGIGRLAPVLGMNSAAADVGFNAMYGATQDSNPMRGAIYGAAGGAGGTLGGRAVGGFFPNTYARGAMNEARSSVPSVQDLKDLASTQYRDVEARGVAAGPQDTQRLSDEVTQFLTREGRITPQGNLLDVDNPTSRALRLIQDYAGSPMTPTQAQNVRRVVAEGAANPDPSQQRLGTMLTDQFDQWADPVLPGINVPRATSQRYLQGQQLQEALDISGARGSRMKGNDVGDAVRTRFGQIDEAMIDGRARFTPFVAEAIQNTARGDPYTNALRQIGKFGAQNPVTMLGGGGAAGMAANAVGGPVVGIGTGLAVAGLGSAARATAGARTTRSAEEAIYRALGGDDYARLAEEARAQARRNAGSIYGGLFGSGASINARQ